MIQDAWSESVDQFIGLSHKHGVRMIMVGGGAVNFHGYQRHSADVDFWIETTEENFKKLLLVVREMGYGIEDFPNSVKHQEQNISLKFSQVDIQIELITRFSVNKTFDEAFEASEVVVFKSGLSVNKWRVLSYGDLITSKIKAGRPKDLLDIQELKRIKNSEK